MRYYHSLIVQAYFLSSWASLVGCVRLVSSQPLNLGFLWEEILEVFVSGTLFWIRTRSDSLLGRKLFFYRRNTLIRISIYYLSVFQISTSTKNTLDQLFRNFLWGGVEGGGVSILLGGRW